jgi:hypothetical protein
MTILGLCNFAAPGIWVAINSLGGGGEQEPYLVNTSNALTFCLMVLSCWFSGTLVHYIGIKGALVFGTYVGQSISVARSECRKAERLTERFAAWDFLSWPRGCS